MAESISMPGETTGDASENPATTPTQAPKEKEIPMPQTRYLRIRRSVYYLFWLLSDIKLGPRYMITEYKEPLEVLLKIHNSRKAIAAVEGCVWFALLSLIGPFSCVFNVAFNIIWELVTENLTTGSTTLHVFMVLSWVLYYLFFFIYFLVIQDNISEFLSSLKALKDNPSPQPCEAKSSETLSDQNASSEHQNERQPESNEKYIKLPNGFRTVWKDQSYCYATGKFEPSIFCTKEKPGILHGPFSFWYPRLEEKWFDYYEAEPPNDVVFLLPFTYLMILYLSDINIGPGLRICEERERVETIRRIKSEAKAFQALTAGLFFAIFAFFFTCIEDSIYYFIPKDEWIGRTILISIIYYGYRVYYVVSFISVFYTARKFFKSFKPKKNPKSKPDPRPSAPMEDDIVANFTPGNLCDAQAHDC